MRPAWRCHSRHLCVVLLTYSATHTYITTCTRTALCTRTSQRAHVQRHARVHHNVLTYSGCCALFERAPAAAPLPRGGCLKPRKIEAGGKTRSKRKRGAEKDMTTRGGGLLLEWGRAGRGKGGERGGERYLGGRKNETPHLDERERNAVPKGQREKKGEERWEEEGKGNRKGERKGEKERRKRREKEEKLTPPAPFLGDFLFCSSFWFYLGCQSGNALFIPRRCGFALYSTTLMRTFELRTCPH